MLEECIVVELFVCVSSLLTNCPSEWDRSIGNFCVSNDATLVIDGQFVTMDFLWLLGGIPRVSTCNINNWIPSLSFYTLHLNCHFSCSLPFNCSKEKGYCLASIQKCIYLRSYLQQRWRTMFKLNTHVCMYLMAQKKRRRRYAQSRGTFLVKLKFNVDLVHEHRNHRDHHETKVSYQAE